MADWTFLTHHTHVLLCIARNPDVRLRELAESVGLTERAVQSIVNDLVDAGYVVRSRVGRSNHYELVPGRPLRHPLQQAATVDDLIQVLG